MGPGQSIQRAINASTDGDEIIVAPGTYFETIDFLGKAITLRSSDGPDVTIIDAQQTDTVVTCDSGEGLDTALIGFTITGGSGLVGGMWNANSSPTVATCIFADNTGFLCGGMYNRASSPSITDCTFIDNTGTNAGGMYNQQAESSPTVTNCDFHGNTGSDGAGMYNIDFSHPTVVNCTFRGNMSSHTGGGMSNRRQSNPTVINCTFNGNTATVAGGGIFNGGGLTTVTNCVLWGDSPPEISTEGVAVVVVTYSNVQGGFPGAGNIDADPLFRDAPNGDLRPQAGSPCIDYGDSLVAGLAATDFDGNPRQVNDVCTLDPSCGFGPPVDMGAFEYQAPLCVETPIHNVTRDVYYECIQTAIDDAADTHEIIVAPGTYVENINFHGKAITLRSSHGPDVTTIDGQQTGTVVSCLGGEGPDTVLTGFTITGGSGFAGGMWIGHSSPTVTDCTFSGNWGDQGGGIRCSNSSATIINCTFRDNSGGWSGGITCMFGSATVVNCTFSDNSGAAGGIFCIGPTTVRDCSFSGNSGTAGGIIVLGDSATVVNCTFSSNSGSRAGGIFCPNGSVPIINCTFSGNSADLFGAINGPDATVVNSILWGNSPGEISSEATVQYSVVQGGHPGPGNIRADPLFVDPVNGDLRLSRASPALDAGHNWAIAPLAATDLLGNPRFAADTNDVDTGCGLPVVVDMGSYEFQGEPFAVKYGDVTGDGAVDIADQVRLLAAWGPCTEICCLADLDRDGFVGINDFLTLLAEWR